MNTETAESLLRCHREGRVPDSRMQKALRWAENSPDAKRLLSDQLEFDGQIVEAIHSIHPPENLRQKLAALGAKPRPEEQSIRKKIVDPAMLSAMTGGVVILGIIAFFIWQRSERFAGREAVERMIDSTAKLNQDFEPVSSTTDQMGDWLYMRGYEGYETPPEIAALHVVGSRVYHLDGKPIAQLEVSRNDTPSLVYEFHAGDFGVELPQDGDWKIITQNDWVAAIRQHGERCFMITFRGGASDMQDLLQSLAHK